MEKTEKLSYEELSAALNSTQDANKKIIDEYNALAAKHQRLIADMNSRSFEYAVGVLTNMLKIIEHGHMFSSEFLSYVTENVEVYTKAFIDITKPTQEETGNSEA